MNSGLVSHCLNGRLRKTGGVEFLAADVFQAFPGEEWREVDILALVTEKQKRKQVGSKTSG